MNVTPPTPTSMIPVVCLLALAGVASDGLAQAEQACPLPDGVAPPPDPSVTAQQVEDGSASLMDFALAARVGYKTPLSTMEAALYFQCLVRQEGSPWRSGSTYLVQLTPDGRVYEHSKSMALSGRLLNPWIYGAILSSLGVPPTVLADLASPDPSVAAAAFEALFGALAQEPDAPFDATGLGIPGASGHAAVFLLGSGLPILLLAGFDLDESHLIEEEVDYGDPAITARDVVDRETLKAFVAQAGEWFIPLVETATDPAAISKARIAARDPNGPWRHGSVYLYVLDLTSGIILFHGAFPDQFEWRPLVATVRDVVTGELILPQIIEAAKSDPEGGFVEYYFDDPTDDTDSADIPKVGYARQFAAQIGRADGTVFPLDVIIGSGFYGREHASTDIAGEGLPEESAAGGLVSAAPNPFNSATRIGYRLSAPGPVRLAIYNVLGQPVRTLVDRFQGAGTYRAQWDARDQRGAPLSSGVYIARLSHPGGVEARRLLYLE